MEKSPADVLEEAADLLLIHGRCKGTGRKPDGSYCVMGATAAAAGLPEDECDFWIGARHTAAGRALAEHLGDAWDHPSRTSVCLDDSDRLWWWNDNTDDDFEIIDTLKHVAKTLRNGES